jgi:hypothetical protein
MRRNNKLWDFSREQSLKLRPGYTTKNCISVTAIKTSLTYEIKEIHDQSSSCRQIPVCVIRILRELYSFSTKGQTVPGTKKCY